jgi:hypothetical protein
MSEIEQTVTTPAAKPSKSKFKGGKQATQKNRPKSKTKENKPVSVAARVITPAFLYVSACCSALGTKEPLVWSEKDKEKKSFSENHKGSFRCSKCNKPTKVSRTKNTDGVQIAL